MGKIGIKIYIKDGVGTKVRRSHSVYNLSSLKPAPAQPILTKSNSNMNTGQEKAKRRNSEHHLNRDISKYKFELDEITLILKRKKLKKCFSYKFLEKKLSKPYNNITLSSENYNVIFDKKKMDSKLRLE
jgi:hypothetical protein